MNMYGWTIAGSAEGHRRCTVCGEPAYLMGKHPETTLYRCTSCSHCFSTIDEIMETYDPSYYEAAHRRWFENPNIALFERIRNALDHRSGLRIIDVGCGRGHLLRYLESKRSDAHFLGIDLSPNENTKRIKYSQGDFLTTDLGFNYDVVISLATIEHVVDVQSFARRLTSLCRPGGQVIVMTVNESSLLYGLARNLKMAGFPIAFDRLYSAHHINHFTVKSLRRLVEQTGLAVERSCTHNAPIASIDIPLTNSSVLNAGLRTAMVGICVLGNLTSSAYLQTIFCRRTT